MHDSKVSRFNFTANSDPLSVRSAFTILQVSVLCSLILILCSKNLFIDLRCSQVSGSLLLRCLIKTTSSSHWRDNRLLNQSNKTFTVLFLTFSTLIFLSLTSVFFFFCSSLALNYLVFIHLSPCYSLLY